MRCSVVLLVATLSFAGNKTLSGSKEDVAKDDSLFLGNWVLKKLEYGLLDEVSTIPVAKGQVKLIVKAGKIVLIDEGQPKEYSFTVYPGANPRKLDVLDVIDDNEGKRWPLKCIVAVEKDALKVCFYHGISRIAAIPYFDPRIPRPLSFSQKGDIAPWVILDFVRETKAP